MADKKPIKKIKQSGLQRRLAISVAGALSGTRLLTKHATSMLLPENEKAAARSQALAAEAKVFTAELGELKGAYVKIGQMMALYGVHLLPQEVTAALHELEHQTSSLEWSAIQPEIEQALGERSAELQIKQQPLAAASLAQVHRARHIASGRELCLKVQYPGVASTIESDFKTVLQMLRLTRWVKSGREFEAWTKEIKAMLLDEVDYAREQKMAERVATLIGDDPRYRVPQIDPHYSAGNVLGMEYMPGLEVTHAKISKLSQNRRNELAKSMLEIFFQEIFNWGIMQTDPNFGNYRIQLRESAEQADRLVLLDFGAVREMDDAFLKALQKTIIAAYKNDQAAVIEGAIELRCLKSAQSKRVKQSFADFCILLMEPFRRDQSNIPAYALNSKNQYRWYESNLLKRVAKLGATSVAIDGFSSPPREFALIARKLTGVFTFVTTLRAEINAHKILDQYL